MMAELLWDANRKVPTAEDVSMSAMAHESFSFEYFVFNLRPVGATARDLEELYAALDADLESKLAGLMPEWEQLSDYVRE